MLNRNRSFASYSLEVVGAAHANADGSNRRFIIAMMAPGEQVELRPEPKNKHDPYAVAVFSGRGGQLGYLRAERAPHIGKLIRQGMEIRAVFQAATDHGAWIRVAFDGAEPVLPPPRPAATAEEREFWPDDEWDEPA
ncbi:HIRAN domain-containing protein [Alteraurantiacibacter buctensis]|uniref:HIRAN domain-containing protein n=1 Tax=Alteraurantiacibacter buctensis TaxID=1503981 RepID=A0A844Z176_9SPHN|nr:HIRAN domain-containing protein [Alteraurantiacibacter buctensis]MXO73549.1 hypothetical protein [Alteraurantiacibacter buctensis]